MRNSKYITVYLKVFLLLVLMIFIIANFVYPIYYRNSVKQYSTEYDVDEFLIYSIIKAESGHNKDAVSPKGATGLMQIMDSTAIDVMNRLKIEEDLDRLTDPDFNIRIGTYYVKYLLERYDGNFDKAIAAYNAGLSNADRWQEDANDEEFLQNIDIKETREYVKRVNQNNTVYEFLYGQLNLEFISLPDLFAQIKVFGTDILRSIKGWVMTIIEKN